MHSPQPSLNPSVLATDPVSYTMSSLVAHMGQCERARSPWFRMEAQAELAHTLISSRLVTCGALVVLCGMALASVA